MFRLGLKTVKFFETDFSHYCRLSGFPGKELLLRFIELHSDFSEISFPEEFSSLPSHKSIE